MNLLVLPQIHAQQVVVPALGLVYLAANTNCEIYDAARMGMSSLQSLHPNVLGIPMYTATRHESLDILKWGKDNGAITVAGGPHVTIMTNQLIENYPFVDHWVIGDGELAWKEICEGNIPRSVKVIDIQVPDLNKLPIPAWEKVDWQSYDPRVGKVFVHRGRDLREIPRIPIVFSRGCRGSCSFCSTHWVSGKYRVHSYEWMLEHLQKLWDLGVRHLVFSDDCMTTDTKAVLYLCDALGQFDFSWVGTTRVDCLDLDLAKRLVEVGCYELTFGVESGSPTILKRMNKLTNPDTAFITRDICRKVGISFTALMMYGFPGETSNTIKENRLFLEKLKPDDIGSVGHTMIFPGTAIYSMLKKRNLIDDSYWLDHERYPIYCGGLE